MHSRRSCGTEISVNRHVGKLVRAMHPEQQLAGAWQWAGEPWGLLRPRATCRWALNTRTGGTVAVVLDKEAPLLRQNFVTRPLWEAWRWDPEREHEVRERYARETERFSTVRLLFRRQLADLNERAREVLGDA